MVNKKADEIQYIEFYIQETHVEENPPILTLFKMMGSGMSDTHRRKILTLS